MSKLTNDDNASATPRYYCNAWSPKRKGKKEERRKNRKKKNNTKLVLLRMLFVLQNGLEWQQILYFSSQKGIVT
jgi:hypothetical protein